MLTHILSNKRYIAIFASFKKCWIFSYSSWSRSWIIERLDRKLADAIGSNIVEKCDVTLSRAIQPHSTFCASYVSSHISLSLSSTIHIGHVLK